MKTLRVLFFILMVPLTALSQQIYTSDTNGFTITIPADWKMKTWQEPNIEVFAIKDDNSYMGVSFSKDSLYEGKTLNDLGLDFIRDALFPGHKLIDSGNTEINGSQTYYFKDTFKKEALSFIVKHYTLLKNGIIFIISVVCLESEYKSYERIFDSIVYSFKFL